MRPAAVLLSIFLGVISLGFVVWIGRFGATIPKIVDAKFVTPEPTVDDVQVPKSGPFGKAEVPSREFDFGAKLIHLTQQHEHIFKINNIGEGPLDFKLGKPTCQCTSVSASKEDGTAFADGKGTLKPHESMNVLIQYVTKTRMEKFRHGVKIFTSDPDMRTIDLSIVGAVDPPFYFRPEGVWDLHEMSTTEPSKAEGLITSKIFGFEVVEEPRDNPRVKVILEPLDAEQLAQFNVKGGYKVRVEAGPDVPVGMLRESIKLKSSGGGEEQIIEFTVVGRRYGPIEIRGVSPGASFNAIANRLIIYDFPADTGKTVKLRLFAKGVEEDLVLKAVEPADTRYKVTLSDPQMLGKSKNYQLEIEIPPGPVVKRRGAEADAINLTFNHPEAPDFHILLDYNAVR